MGVGQIICGIFLLLAIGAFVISYFQFREKGYLLNNAYFWASQEERRRMDERKESKKPHYRQSGFAFMLIGFIFLIYAVYIMTHWIWTLAALVLTIITAIVYAVISAIKMEQRK